LAPLTEEMPRAVEGSLEWVGGQESR
jgi:hypothetical protein